MDKRGPFHVITFERDHGGITDFIQCANVDELLEAAWKYLNGDYIKYEFCDENRGTYLSTEMNDLDEIFGEEEIDVDRLIKTMVTIGSSVTDQEYGYGWMYVIEGGHRIDYYSINK